MMQEYEAWLLQKMADVSAAADTHFILCRDIECAGFAWLNGTYEAYHAAYETLTGRDIERKGAMLAIHQVQERWNASGQN